RVPKNPPPVAAIGWKAPGGADRLELLASALGHGGLEALLAHALEEGRVGFGLDDAVELAPIGRDEATPVDLQIVDAPPAVPEMETVVEGDLAAAIGEDLRPHGGVVRVDGLAEVSDIFSRVGLDPVDVGTLVEFGEERHELGALVLRA